SVYRNGIVTRSRPVDDAIEQVACRIDLVGDSPRLPESSDPDLSGRRQAVEGCGSDVANGDVGVASRCRLIADKQAMPTRAEIDIQSAADIVSGPGPEVESAPGCQVEVRV